MTERNGRDDGPTEIPASAGWSTFEARIRGRRFARCVEHATSALETGDVDEAKRAIDEARQLFPNAPEIPAFEQRILEAAAIVPAADIEDVDDFSDLSIRTPEPFEDDSPLGPDYAPGILLSQASAPRAGRGFFPTLVGLSALAAFGFGGFALARHFIPADGRFSTELTDVVIPGPAGSATGQPERETLPASPAAATPAAAESTGTTSPPAASDAGAAEQRQAAAPQSESVVPSSPAPPIVPAAPASTSLGNASIAGNRPALSDGEKPAGARETARTARNDRPDDRIREGQKPEAGSSETLAARLQAAFAKRSEGTAAAATPPPGDIRPAVEEKIPVTIDAVPTSSVGTAGLSAAPGLPEPPLPMTVAPASASAAAAGSPFSRATDTIQIRNLLNRYETAYNRLDARAATDVWPGVNTGALDRAFKDLVSQRVSLGLCDITIIGDIGGATCMGKARWEPRVGGGMQTADRHWTFDLRRADNSWHIEQIRVR